MSHSQILSQIAQFKSEISAAQSVNKIHVFGETNSGVYQWIYIWTANSKSLTATQGGGGISPTFGAGLWILDYIMQTLILGTKVVFHHARRVGTCSC
jgi:hypothetical protein